MNPATELQPQPQPIPDGPHLHDLVAQRILEYQSCGDQSGQVAAAILARKQKGIETYGTPLQAHNGRDPRVDAYQEILDCLAYTAQAAAEGRLNRLQTAVVWSAACRIAQVLAGEPEVDSDDSQPTPTTPRPVSLVKPVIPGKTEERTPNVV